MDFQLINDMLTFDWRRRPDIWQVGRHPYWASLRLEDDDFEAKLVASAAAAGDHEKMDE